MSVVNKTIKYRARPTIEQSVLFAKTFGCCRKVYNLMLDDKISHYKIDQSFGKQTPAMYKADYPYLKEVDSLALANVQLNLQQAMKNHFSNKAHYGFPKFKSAKRSKKSYTTNNQHGTIAICDGKIKLPKVGWVKIIQHRDPDPSWNLKSATVSQDPDGKFYISVLFEYDATITPAAGTTAIGLDYKSDGLYTDSNNVTAHMPKYYRDSQSKLAKEQRKLSRKMGSRKNEPKSNNYIKQQHKLAKLHKHIANQRLDYLHKLSTEITNQYDIVCVESLNMQAMSNKGFGNGKSTLDNGYGLFLQLLEYKLAAQGKYLIKIDKWYPSSQLCSCCGFKTAMPLQARTYTCENCGIVIDRDYNAAINIRNEGLHLFHSAA